MIIGEDYIVHRKFFGIFEVIQIFTSIGSGVIDGLGRAIKAGAIAMVVGI
jgi:hypothetical protein